MKPVGFHPDADAEVVDAAVWYESRQDDLGKRFLIAVQDALNKIEVNPDPYPFVEGDVRRCLTKTFPFGVMFRVKPNVIAVMAIMHLHRDPNYWKNRRACPVVFAFPLSRPAYLILRLRANVGELRQRR